LKKKSYSNKTDEEVDATHELEKVVASFFFGKELCHHLPTTNMVNHWPQSLLLGCM